MLRALCWLSIGGCLRGGPPPSRPEIEIRMATDGEFSPERGSSDPFSPAFNEWCAPRGVSAPGQFEPIVTFAREQLIVHLDRFGLTATSPVHTRLVVPHQPEPPTPRGIVVTVTPMSEQGGLEVANFWGDGGNAFKYCLHVVREGTHTTVVLEELMSVISVNDQPAAPEGNRLSRDEPTAIR